MTTPRKRTGRPRLDPDKAERHTITMTPAEWRYVEQQGKTRSAGMQLVVQRDRSLHWLLAMAQKPGWVDPPPVGVELDPEYVEAAKRRVEEAMKGEGSE